MAGLSDTDTTTALPVAGLPAPALAPPVLGRAPPRCLGVSVMLRRQVLQQ